MCNSRVEFAVHFMKPNGTVLYQMWQMWKAAVEDVKDVVGFYPTFVTNLDPKSANTIAKTNGIGNVWGRDDTESGICKLILLFCKTSNPI